MVDGYFLYKITNLINGKIYIGQTNDFDRRWYEHCNRAQNIPRQTVEYAIKKYGVNSFQYELLENVSSREEANLKEILYIKEHSSIYPNGYNIEKGGKYQPQSQLTLQKISAALKGRPSINKGKPCSEEQKKKTSATMTGRKYDQERIEKSAKARQGIPAWNKGKSKLSEEQKLSIKTDNRLYKDIAREYGISIATISQIKKN